LVTVDWANESRAGVHKKILASANRSIRKTQKASGNAAFFGVSSMAFSGVDPAGGRSYNRPTVMDGKASFLC
jgi:hypothetical protein